MCLDFPRNFLFNQTTGLSKSSVGNRMKSTVPNFENGTKLHLPIQLASDPRLLREGYTSAFSFLAALSPQVENLPMGDTIPSLSDFDLPCPGRRISS